MPGETDRRCDPAGRAAVRLVAGAADDVAGAVAARHRAAEGVGVDVGRAAEGQVRKTDTDRTVDSSGDEARRAAEGQVRKTDTDRTVDSSGDEARG